MTLSQSSYTLHFPEGHMKIPGRSHKYLLENKAQCSEFSFVSDRILLQHFPCSEKNNYINNVSEGLNKRADFHFYSTCLEL